MTKHYILKEPLNRMGISKTINLNALAQGIGKVISVTFGFLTLLVLRRFLGRQNFGDYIFIFSVVLIFVSLSDFGTHLVSVKEAAQREKIQAKVLGNVLLLRFFLSLIGILLAFLLVLFFLKEKGVYFPTLLALPLIVLLGLKNSLMVVFHSKLKLYLASLQEVLAAFLLFASSLIVAWKAADLSSYIFLTIASYLFVFILFALFSLKRFEIKFDLDFTLLKHLFCQSFPLGTILLIFTLYSRIDTMILKFSWGADSVAVYGLAYKVYENLTLPAAFLMNAVLPPVAKNIKSFRKERICSLLQIVFDLLLFGAIVFIFSIFLAAPLIMKILTGASSFDEVFVLRILLLALPFAFLNHLTGYTIIVLGQQKKSLLISLCALFFNFLANIFLIPRFSFKAAAFNAVLTQGLVFLLSWRILRKELAFYPRFFAWPKTVWWYIKNRGRVFD